MGYVKLVLGALILAVFAAALHYYIPQRVIVRVLNTEVIREDYEATGANGEIVTRSRDVRQIYAETPGGETREFNNIDAPAYLKFDSAALAARAEQYIDPTRQTWVVVTYYGWRFTFFSWFPNAITLREAEGPDETITIWPNVGIVAAILLTLGILWRLLVIQWRRFTDPVRERWEEEYDATHGFFGRLRRRIFGDNSVS
ncbi:MAG: DUF1523 family protein [Pseudomonadota bacterium]